MKFSPQLTLLILLAGIGAYTAYQGHGIETMLLIHEQETEHAMQYLENSWVSARGTVTVHTDRNEGEAVEAWKARHKEAVDAAWAEWPAVQGQ